ncbi:hypothetical protein GQ53DRAFT_787969 [Thozetella sp. PMI_491]|nr:hypothetical protein GQ53DRAFT_787969 [Thozetella sp. PMI_491]
MEQCASVLLSFPTDQELSDEQYNKQARQHVAAIEKMAKERLLVPFAEELLEHVNPSYNSISYLALLQTVYSELKTAQVSEELLARTANFLVVFDARQIRYFGITLTNLLGLLADGEVFPASIGVELLASTLLRLDPTGSILTSHHLGLVSLAYHTDNVEPALKAIDKTIVFYAGAKEKSDKRLLCDRTLPPTAYMTPESGLTGKLTAAMVLEYDFLVGLCYLSQKKWQQAFEAFERVITFPTRDNGCSKIMVEAYNKWLLTGLLLNGKAPSFPSNTSSSAQKAYNVMGKPYQAVAKAFEQPTADQLKTELTTLGQQFWREERNLGLVNEVLAHYQKWQVLKLRDVYTKISLEQIRTSTQDAETAANLPTEPEVVRLVQDMIEDGMLRGEITKPANGKPAYLTFLPEAGLSEARFADEIRESARRIQGLEPALKVTHERLATSRDYIRHLVKEKARADKGGPNEMGMFESQVDDEDLMTGIQSSL